MQLEPQLKFFAQYIESELGIVYADHNYFQLQNRLEEIAKLLSVESVEKLCELGKAGISGAFKQLLLDTATNNETSFFRDQKVFRAIETTFQNKPLNIWSAASSSGQEALSIAMMILEWNKKTGNQISFKITGTDISERILAKAKAAQYSQLEVQRGLPAPLMIKYFKKDESDRWTASSELTQNISYQKVNLKERFPFTQLFDVILCRNVLIYQSVEGKREILTRLRNQLTPEGVLVLGAGESLIGLSDGFSQVLCEGAVIYKRKEETQKAA